MQNLIDQLFMFYHDNSVFCMVAGGILVVLLLWKPVKVLKGIILLIILAAVLYVAIRLVDSVNFGSSLKKSGIERTEKALNE